MSINHLTEDTMAGFFDYILADVLLLEENNQLLHGRHKGEF